MSLSIRPLTPDDYVDVAAIASVVYETTLDPENMRWEDSQRDPKCRCARWVAELNGKTVGFAEQMQYPGIYHPRKFDVGVDVLPDYRGRGIGSALWNTVWEAVQAYDPITLTAGARENCEDALRFLAKRGFVEKLRNWESHLDLTTFDPAQFQDQVEGCQVRSYADLSAEPDFYEKLYALVCEVRRDVPSTAPLTDVPYEAWLKNQKSNPHLWPQGYQIAVKGSEWVGVSNLWTTAEAGVLNTGLTAVKREHRGTGIALALKVRALATAKAAGYRLVKTWNESNNERMLAINVKLGFVRKPAWVSFQLRLKQED